MRMDIEDGIRNEGGAWHIPVTFTDDTGQVVRRELDVIPEDTLEWRAAEYGIDPADTATLMDIVIAEAHMTPEDWEQGTHLHSAPDIDTARADHLARCARVKLRHRFSTRKKTSPLNAVRDLSPLDHEVVGIKAEHVHRQRKQLAATAARTAKPVRESRPDRVARLRAELLGPSEKQQQDARWRRARPHREED